MEAHTNYGGAVTKVFRQMIRSGKGRLFLIGLIVLLLLLNINAILSNSSLSLKHSGDNGRHILASTNNAVKEEAGAGPGAGAGAGDIMKRASQKEESELNQTESEGSIDTAEIERRHNHDSRHSQLLAIHDSIKSNIEDKKTSTEKRLAAQTPVSFERETSGLSNSKSTKPNDPYLIYNGMPNFTFTYTSINSERLCKTPLSIEANPSTILSKDDLTLNMIVYVHTAPSHFSHRNAIRNTWASLPMQAFYRFRIIFLLGLTDNATQAKLEKEAATHRDLVQGNFQDSYHNLTYKGLLGLRWVSEFCQNAKYILKTDDDVFINIPTYVSFLKEKHPVAKRSILCIVWHENGMPILRDKAKCMKWCVGEDEFPGKDKYPQYCAGMSFTISTDVSRELLYHSYSTRPFWIDDLYITGLLSRKLNPPLTYINTGKYYNLKSAEALGIYSNYSTKATLPMFVLTSPHNFDKFFIRSVNRWLLSGIVRANTTI